MKKFDKNIESMMLIGGYRNLKGFGKGFRNKPSDHQQP